MDLPAERHGLTDDAEVIGEVAACRAEPSAELATIVAPQPTGATVTAIACVSAGVPSLARTITL
jgi:hypothetical protein